VFFFEVKNLLDKTYIASANNITNSLNATTGLQNPGTVPCRDRDGIDLCRRPTDLCGKDETGVPVISGEVSQL
jgi:hypothetical protein